MDITMQLMWDLLSERDGVRKYGIMRSIPLRRPELLVEDGPTEEGHIYVAEASAIPSNMDFNRNALMVCAARDDFAFTKVRFPLFVVPGSLAEVFNLVAEIYDRYDQWDRSLQQILNADARPLSLLQASLPILGNTLYLNDNKMNFIGKIIGMDRFHLQKGDGNDQSDSVEGVLLLPHADSIKERIVKHGYDINPRLFNEFGVPMYGIDLFFGKSRVGSLCLEASMRPFRGGDPELLSHLARCVEAALSKRNSIIETQASSLREILLKLLDGGSVSEESIRSALLSSGDDSSSFRCIVVRAIDDALHVQADYLCRLIESSFGGCLAVEYRDGVVVLFDTASMVLTEKLSFNSLGEFLAPLRLCAGISKSFQDLAELEERYQEAVAALETAPSRNPGDLCFFEDNVLRYMIQHSCGAFSPSVLFPSGLLRLQEFCMNREVDYLHVLRVWLECGCNASEASRRLYLHRSTLMKRLDRIREILDNDLSDPDYLLLLQLCIRLSDLG